MLYVRSYVRGRLPDYPLININSLFLGIGTNEKMHVIVYRCAHLKQKIEMEKLSERELFFGLIEK